MRFAYPPYDFLIVLTGSLLAGLIVRQLFFGPFASPKGGTLLTAVAIAYIPISISFAFVINDLPLKFYGPPVVLYDPEKSSGLGPQSVTKEGLERAGTYLLSVAFNFIAWLFCIGTIIRHFSRRKRVAPESSSFLDEVDGA